MEIKNTAIILNADDADLASSAFHNVNLTGARFTDVNLADSSFEDINFAGAKFMNVNMADVEITDCNLSGMTIDGILVSELLAVYRAR